jgi:DNA-binding MarR family transcriptional regulator
MVSASQQSTSAVASSQPRSGPGPRRDASAVPRPSARSRRITELAELEGLAQPTITILIKQLEEKGLVTRTRQSGDGRVVLVDLTDSGNVALEHYRGRLRAVLGGYLAEIADEQVAALATATETLAQLVDVLQQRPAR